MMKKISLVFLISTLFFSCTKEPVPIHFGEDGCSYCRMIISDQRFGGELLTTKAKAYKFDSIECMAAYIIKAKKDSENIHSLWTIDYNNPKLFVNASQAWYLQSKNLKSPMGAGLSSFKEHQDIEIMQTKYEGKVLRWNEVKEAVRLEWLK